MRSSSNGDYYRRESAIVDGAEYNGKVNELFEQHYQQIHSLFNIDKDVFQDTYLRLTISFDCRLDFINEFKRMFFNTLREKQTRDLQYQITHKSLSNANYPAIAEEAD